MLCYLLGAIPITLFKKVKIMSIMSDAWIKSQCQGDTPMLTPFYAESVSTLPNGKKVCSFGTSSYGYDLSLGSEFRLLKTTEAKNFTRRDIGYNLRPAVAHIDPCNFDPGLLDTIKVPEDGTFLLPARAFALGVTVERIRMPKGFMGVCMEKSTCARSALGVTVTPIEPEWEGYLTLELHNHTDFPIILTPGMGICQLLFFKGDQNSEISYKDRGGKYQNQPNSPVAATRKTT